MKIEMVLKWFMKNEFMKNEFGTKHMTANRYKIQTLGKVNFMPVYISSLSKPF